MQRKIKIKNFLFSQSMESKGFQRKNGFITHYYKKKFYSYLLSFLTFSVTSLCTNKLSEDQGWQEWQETSFWLNSIVKTVLTEDRVDKRQGNKANSL